VKEIRKCSVIEDYRTEPDALNQPPLDDTLAGLISIPNLKAARTFVEE